MVSNWRSWTATADAGEPDPIITAPRGGKEGNSFYIVQIPVSVRLSAAFKRPAVVLVSGTEQAMSGGRATTSVPINSEATTTTPQATHPRVRDDTIPISRDVLTVFDAISIPQSNSRFRFRLRSPGSGIKQRRQAIRIHRLTTSDSSRHASTTPSQPSCRFCSSWARRVTLLLICSPSSPRAPARTS